MFISRKKRNNGNRVPRINCGFARMLEEEAKFTEHDHRRDDRWKTVERTGPTRSPV